MRKSRVFGWLHACALRFLLQRYKCQKRPAYLAKETY